MAISDNCTLLAFSSRYNPRFCFTQVFAPLWVLNQLRHVGRATMAQSEHDANYASKGYGGQKRATECVLEQTAPPELPWTVVRPGHIYGPDAHLGCLHFNGRDTELVAHLLARRPLRLVAGGTYLQQPIFVTDFGRSYYETLGHLLGHEVEIESVPESSFLTDYTDKAPFCCDRVYDLASLRETGVPPPATSLAVGFRQFLAAMHPGIKRLLIPALGNCSGSPYDCST